MGATAVREHRDRHSRAARAKKTSQHDKTKWRAHLHSRTLNSFALCIGTCLCSTPRRTQPSSRRLRSNSANARGADEESRPHLADIVEERRYVGIGVAVQDCRRPPGGISRTFGPGPNLDSMAQS